jgi:hypothetical protein
MEDKKKVAGWPSSYDFFYYDSMVFEKALSIRKKILENANSNLIYGYIYLLELLISAIAQHVEDMPNNMQKFEIIHWGRFDLGSREMQEIAKNDDYFRLVLVLNRRRRNLSNLLHALLGSNSPDIRKDLEVSLEALDVLIKEINSKVVEFYNPKRLEGVDDTNEKLMILNWFLNTVLYEGPRPFFSTMTDSIAFSYRPLPQYIDGFKFCLKEIFIWLTSNKSDEKIENNLKEFQTWKDSHSFWVTMVDTFTRGVELKRLFEIKIPEEQSKNLIDVKKITDKYQLNVLFRGRGIKAITVFENILESDNDVLERLFTDALQGNLLLNEPKAEIIEFKELKNYKEGWGWEYHYTYALYVPMHGFIGDASSWLIFPSLTVETDQEDDYFRTNLQNIVKEYEDKIRFSEYEIKTGLIESYIAEKDRATIRKLWVERRLDSSRGLLAEFLAYFYFWDRHDAKLIEFHKEEAGTEIDVVCEDDAARYIVQAKNSVSIRKDKLLKEIEKITKQFVKVEKKYTVPNKPTIKVLFVVDWAWDAEDPGEDRDENVLEAYRIAQQMLGKYNIQLVIYAEIKDIVSRRHKDFVEKSNSVFDLVDK